MAEPELPEDWAEQTGVTRPVRDYVNWSWNGPTAVVGSVASGKAMFDFRVFPYVNGNLSAESDDNEAWASTFTYKVVDISGPNRGFNSATQPSQQRLIREILLLSYATSNPLPKRGDKLFPEEGTGDYAVGVMDNPIVDTISVKQDGDKPDVWFLTYSAKKYKRTQVGRSRPETAENAPSIRDPYPWERRPKITANAGSESFNVGQGYFLGSKTPNQIAAVITANNDGLAGLLTPSGSEPYEIIKNSAGDPFKNPPQSKVSVTVFDVTVAYSANETLTSLISAAKTAAEFVNSADFNIGINAATFAIRKGTAMLTSFSVSPADYQDKRDWLPNQLHPFGKTYAELGWTMTDGSTGVAINTYKRTLSVNQTVPYTIVRIGFSVKEVGWGVAIPDKGYRSLKTGTLQKIKDSDSSASEERLLNGSGVEVDVGVDTSDVPCLRLYSPFGASTALASLLDSLPWDRTEA